MLFVPTATPERHCDWPSPLSTRCGDNSRNSWSSSETTKKVWKWKKTHTHSHRHNQEHSLIHPFLTDTSPHVCYVRNTPILPLHSHTRLKNACTDILFCCVDSERHTHTLIDTRFRPSDTHNTRPHTPFCDKKTRKVWCDLLHIKTTSERVSYTERIWSSFYTQSVI